MIGDYEALLRGVLEDPGDDLPRLVLADFIEENGDGERAEFIRVQCELAILRGQVTDERDNIGLGWSLPEPHRARSGSLWLREQNLWKANASKWEISCPGSAMGPDTNAMWERGFVSEVRLPLAAFLTHAKELFESHPITKVLLTDREPLLGVVGFENGHRYWFAGDNPSSDFRHRIPGPLYEGLISPCEELTGEAKKFASESEANAALSAACVAYARSLAGLPPMPIPEEVKS